MTERVFLYPSVSLKSLVVWDMENGRALGQLDGDQGEGHDIRLVAARGNTAVCFQDGTAGCRVWNLETLQCAAATVADGPDTAAGAACCVEGGVWVGGADGQIKLWDWTAPAALQVLEGHTSDICSIKASTLSASMALSCSFDKTVRLWDLRTGKCARIMRGHAAEVGAADMDGHCRTAVSSSLDCTVKLWDLGSGRCSATVEGHNCIDTFCVDVAMNESGSSFLSMGANNFVNAWAVAGGFCKAIMRADLALPTLPGADCHRLFASSDLSTVAYLSISPMAMGLRVWK